MTELEIDNEEVKNNSIPLKKVENSYIRLQKYKVENIYQSITSNRYFLTQLTAST